MLDYIYGGSYMKKTEIICFLNLVEKLVCESEFTS